MCVRERKKKKINQRERERHTKMHKEVTGKTNLYREVTRDERHTQNEITRKDIQTISEM